MIELARRLHTQTPMPLQRLWASATLAFLLSSTAASAQIAGTGATTASTLGGVTVSISKVNGTTVRTLDAIYLGIANCQADTPVEFNLSGLPGNRSTVDVWVGDACNAASRAVTTGGGCTFVSTTTATRVKDMPIVIPASKLFKDGCTAGYEYTPQLWFLPVNEPQSSEAVTVYGRYSSLWADASPPPAPSGIVAGGDERSISVSWSAVDAAYRLDKFLIYVDSDPQGATSEQPASDADAGTEAGSGELNPGCPSAVLIAGGEAPASLPDGIQIQEVTNESRTKTSLPAQNFGLGRIPSAIALVAVDKAGNQSPFSQVVCATALPTKDFWETYRSDGGADVEGCPCSTMGKAQLQGGLPVMCALLMLLVSARRRRAR